MSVGDHVTALNYHC